MRRRAQGSGLRARGSGCRARGIEFRVQGLGYMHMVGFRVQGSRVQGHSAVTRLSWPVSVRPCLSRTTQPEGMCARSSRTRPTHSVAAGLSLCDWRVRRDRLREGCPGKRRLAARKRTPLLRRFSNANNRMTVFIKDILSSYTYRR